MKLAYPKIVITDWTFPDLHIEEQILTRGGVELVARPCKTESELIELCRDADAVMTQFVRLNGKVIAAMGKARAIVRYGIGVDNVDLDAASQCRIPVCNIPDYCIDEVADQTLAFILALTRQVVTHSNHLRAGKWGLATPLASMKALRDLTVSVLGCGRIGCEVVRRLLTFKGKICVFDPMVPAIEIEKIGARSTSFNELLRNADILTLHCPSTPLTRRIICRESLGQLKPGAILINVGRGDLVDPEALTAALQSGQVSAAALDVFDPEPIPADHPIRALPNVILSPHIASCSIPALKKLRETAAHLALAAVRGEALPTMVNGVKRS
jgi:D-3-phosphoglycerate dehydrogenase